MNKTHILSNLADELKKIPQNGSNSFEGQKSSDVTDFFVWVVDLFRNGNFSVTVTVADMIPNLLLFSSTFGNHTRVFTPYPTNNYTKTVLNVAILFDSHPHFRARIQKGKKTVTFQFIPN